MNMEHEQDKSNEEQGQLRQADVMRRFAVSLLFQKVQGNEVNQVLYLTKEEAVSEQEALGMGISKAKASGEPWSAYPIALHGVVAFSAA